MNKTTLILILLLCPYLVLPPAMSKEIILEADYWCPMNCTPESDHPGYMVEVARTVFKKHGHSVIYRIRPWPRAIKEAREGIATGIIGAAIDEAPDFIFPSNELFAAPMDAFFVKAGSSWTYEASDSLKEITLGACRNYTYGDILTTFIEKHPEQVQRISSHTPLEINIKKLLAGRVDAIVEFPPVFWHTAHNLGLKDQLQAAGVDPESFKIHIAFSPADPNSDKYAQILSKGIDSLRASGELTSILAKYGLQDWKQPRTED